MKKGNVKAKRKKINDKIIIKKYEKSNMDELRYNDYIEKHMMEDDNGFYRYMSYYYGNNDDYYCS